MWASAPTAVQDTFIEAPNCLLRIAQKAKKTDKIIGFLMQLLFWYPYDILFFVKKQVFSAWIQFL